MAPKNPFTLFDTTLSHRRLKGHNREGWVEEAMDIELDAVPKLGVAHTRAYLGASITKKRIIVLLTLMLFGAVIILGRTFYLQIIKGTYYRTLAESNRVRTQPLLAERGIMYDRFQRELVQNIPNFSLAIITQDLPRPIVQREKVLVKVAQISEVPLELIKSLVDKYSSYSYESVVIRDNIPYEMALKFYVSNNDLPGVIVQSGSKRRYLTMADSNLASSTLSLSHVLGYVSRINDQELKKLHPNGYITTDTIGRTGLEKIYESYLRGTYGRKKIEINSLGKEQEVLSVEPPRPGQNLILTIDKEAQAMLENLVRRSSLTLKKPKIAALAMDARDGQILALVSWPSYDNNFFSGGIDQVTYQHYRDDPEQPLFNRTIAGNYPPGSTAKLIVSSAGLEEKVITKNTTVMSVGGIHVGGSFFKDWRVGGHGLTNVIKALAQSVNTFFYYVGGGYEQFKGLGVDRLLRYFRAFGIGQKTGIDLPGEGTGFVPTVAWKLQQKKEQWFVGDTYNLSIGQGDLTATPLQVAEWTATVANGGTLVQPHLGWQLFDPGTKATTILPTNSTPLEVVAASNLALVREGMRECVLTGSCRALNTLPFTSAGKTGTAQWNKNRSTHAWFTSFAPYAHPQIVVTVLIEEGGEGSSVSVPIAKEFLAWWGRKYLR